MLMRFNNVNVYLNCLHKLKSDVSLPARIHTLEVFYIIYF